ncbi:hypothetical protein Scep_027491 [Stephania cephalantha]|uniref:Uncharacterized protein n=1 Tax=Stephania cephalantha TaxID=152367 RepID=A0AAP0HIJ9_9MAGN
MKLKKKCTGGKVSSDRRECLREGEQRKGSQGPPRDQRAERRGLGEGPARALRGTTARLTRGGGGEQEEAGRRGRGVEEDGQRDLRGTVEAAPRQGRWRPEKAVNDRSTGTIPVRRANGEEISDRVRLALPRLHDPDPVALALGGLKLLGTSRWFQPHFVDIIDLLLGWALVPDLSESDRRIIMDSFLQFRKHWLNNLQFSLGLLSKFLDDMDVLLKDGNAGTLERFRILLALFSCFQTVLKATATEMLEMNFLDLVVLSLFSLIFMHSL